MAKKRLDILLVERALAESREKAQGLIRAAQVLVDGQPACKPGHTFDEHAELVVKSSPRFVGRGGEKLDAAFQAFGLDVRGQVCLDVGASTGGFTDCLLQHGARGVYAVDVGKGLLHWRLRNDPRVTVMESRNARYLCPDDFPTPPSFAAVDVSFISLTKVLPAVIQVLTPVAGIVTLIKPQFEAGRRQVQKGGVVRDEQVRRDVVGAIRTFGTESLALTWLDVCASPVKGPAGNVEFLACWRKGPDERGDQGGA